MKKRIFLLALAPLLFSACNQDQAKLLQMRDEFQRQLDAKDKQIEELMRKLSDSKGGGGGVDAEALAAKLGPELSKAVAHETSQQLAEINKRLDAIDQALGQGRLANTGPAPTAPTGAPNTRPAIGNSSPPADAPPPSGSGKGKRPVIRFDNF